MGSHGQSGCFGEEKNSLSLAGYKLHFLGNPAISVVTTERVLCGIPSYVSQSAYFMVHLVPLVEAQITYK